MIRKQYPLHIYVGVFNPFLRIQQKLFVDLINVHTDIAIVGYPLHEIDADSLKNMIHMSLPDLIPDNVIHTIPQEGAYEEMVRYLENAEKIYCECYPDTEKCFCMDREIHTLFSYYLPKVSWIEFPPEHKHISCRAFWENPVRNAKWIHPDVYTRYVQEKITL